MAAGPVRRSPGRSDSEQAAGRGVWLTLGACLVVLVATLMAAPLNSKRRAEIPLNEAALPKLPSPADLPPVSVPGFRYAHPRLPHPSAQELAFLAAANPAFLKEAARAGAGAQGLLYQATLVAYLEAGGPDADLLYQRLIELKFEGRASDSVKALAVAYDWLYARWNERQRASLRSKLADGCDYLIELIRKERLSPYNVILYNSPFQALMACNVALYGDDPRGEPVMRFTYDLWKRRVLPVWHQVMGQHGGWHEGGEYVGIGIGQAIWQVPAMWRAATGEDVFRQEAGIRGFLDFLVYRTRPDGTDFRWGDAAYFDKLAPDATALALEFRHAAAYTLHPPRPEPAPSGWPWGPLTDVSLLDPHAIERLPLAKYFDGIGLLVARSDWGSDATYVTFAAGDNFWSHTHLDQGAFTIYKGGALAIDSGLYGPEYGSDHHMNYTYQTIAHNAVTVTDPDDKVPAPGKEHPRPIANDGGQRRIGSGWGVEAAPIDREEWEAKREIYHTGSIEKSLDADGLTVAVADVTPAYTNGNSGRGTFSDRTRRVERLWRVFAYDRIDDVVVVYDDVQATRAEFRKRWLLHTIEAPAIDGSDFTVTIAPGDHVGRSGGRLEGHVVFPERAMINSVGGRGLEFFVDDRNFDEGGRVWEIVRSRGLLGPEPGAWRIEVSPEADALDDQFLVVMLPSGIAERPTHKIRQLRSADLIGCEVAGPSRTTRWWFKPGRLGVTVEIGDATGNRSYPLSAPAYGAAEAEPGTWSDAVRRWLHLAR